MEPVSRVPFFQRLSPITQMYVKRVVGIGMSIYLTKAVLTSRQFRAILARFGTWSGVGLREQAGCGDGLPEDESDITSPILSLPPEYRQALWENIPPADLKTLRLVCKQFQLDIDFVVGIHTIVDSRMEERFEWVQHVAVQRCLIEYVDELDNWDFLVKPQCLRVLDTGANCPITPGILDNIIHHFPNLRQITVYFMEENFSNTCRNYEIFRSIDNKKEELSWLEVRYFPETKQCQWTLKFNNTPKINTLNQLLNKSKHNTACLPLAIHVIKLNFDHYSGFDGKLYSQNRYFWKTLLDGQSNLKVLVSNFGPVCWDIHAQTIARNCLTLEKIELHNVNCWESWTDLEDMELRFDWNLFGSCGHLEQLSLHAESGPQLGPILYRPLEVHTMHLQSLHCNFGLICWRFYWSIVLANVNTLNSVCLLGLTSRAGESGEQDPFNWRMFESCKQLKSLMISGQILTYMQTVNFDKIPTTHLEHLGIYWTTLCRKDVIFIGLNMDALESNLEFLDMCCIKGLGNGESPIKLVKACRRGEFPGPLSLQNITGKLKDNPKVIFGILGSIWLWYA